MVTQRVGYDALLNGRTYHKTQAPHYFWQAFYQGLARFLDSPPCLYSRLTGNIVFMITPHLAAVYGDTSSFHYQLRLCALDFGAAKARFGPATHRAIAVGLFSSVKLIRHRGP